LNPNPYIPAATRRELVTPAAHGGRHEQAKRIACSLSGQGFSAAGIFAELRQRYAADVSDKELADIVAWASGKNFTPCAPRFTIPLTSKTPRPAPTKPVDPVANIRKFLADFTADEADLWHESPWRPLENWRIDSLMFLAGMYHAGELVNIVTEYTVEDKGDGTVKTKPSGYGLTLERDAMMRHIRDKGTPQSEAGAWVRMNPTDGAGVADINVAAYRFALIEFDGVPMDLQLSLLARLPLPINAILTSGGRSVHAWVRVNAKSVESYRAKVNELLSLLKPFGVDQCNKNPSRLSRLPGAMRKIGAGEDGQQRLLYQAADSTDSKPILKG
jgi:hypothetical protein